MESENAIKAGVAGLGLLGILFMRTCKAADGAIDNVRPSHFSCNCRPPHNAHVDVSPQVDEIRAVDDPIRVDPPIRLDDIPATTVTADNPEPVIEAATEDVTFLGKTADNEYVYSDGTIRSFNSLNEVSIDNQRVLVVDGQFNEEEIKILNSKGINFVCNNSVYREQKDISNFKVLVFFSDEREQLKNLYSINDDQVDELLGYLQPVIENEAIIKIDTKENLEAKLSALKNDGITPVLVFHNRNQTIFNSPISAYGISNMITCKSYTIPSETFFTSTTFIGTKNVMKSVAEAGQGNLFQFYKEFSQNYAHLQYRDKAMTVTTVIGGVGLTGGAVAVIYYKQNQPEK